MNGHKQKFFKQDRDLDVRALKPGDYRRLINGIPIKPLASGETALDGIIANLLGNEVITNVNLQATSKVVGSLEDRKNNRIFFWVWHSGGDHTIYLKNMNTGSVTMLLRTSVLGLGDTDFVSASISGDILKWTNNSAEIMRISVTKALAGGVYTPTLEELTLIRRPPQLPLTLAGNTTVLTDNNYIYQHHFQFYYRYIYENDEPSVWSALSKVHSGISSSQNLIEVTIPASEVIPATVKQIDYAVRIDETNEFTIYRSDFPVGGVLSPLTHEFFNDVLYDTVPDTESLKWNDSVPRKSKAIKALTSRVFLFRNTEGYEYTNQPLPIVVTVDHSGSFVQGAPYYKEGAAYDVGLMWWDNFGRHAGVQVGVQAIAGLGSRVIIPDDRKNTADNPYVIEVDLTGILLADIPTWATHYSIVRTNASIKFFIQYITSDVQYYHKDSAGEYVYTDTYAGTEEGLVIDISSLTSIELGYTFQKGDRIKIYSIAPLTVGVFDLEIKAQAGKFIYTGLVNLGNTTGTIGITFEIYTPAASRSNVFYEVGEKFAITNPGTGSRALSTTTVTPDGDSTVIRGSYEAMNAFDKFFESWIHRTGRSIGLSPVGSKELLKTTGLRWGQTFNLTSGINLLSTFEALDEQQLPIENGPGTGLAEAGDVLVAIHEVETTAVYVGQGFVETRTGNSFLAKTENVIGDVRRYLGGNGCIDPATIIEDQGKVYFLDRLRGYAVRRSQDGLTRISEYGMRGDIAFLCRYHRETTPSEAKNIIAGWDPQYECYVLTMVNTALAGTFDKATMYFHEKSNGWVCEPQFYPEFYGRLGERLVAFNAGAFWQTKLAATIHPTGYNSFFGVQKYRSLEWEIAPEESLDKIWRQILVDIDAIYTTSSNNEIIVTLLGPDGQSTRINYGDFRLQSGAYKSSFFRILTDAAFGSETESKYKSPHSVRGQSAYLTLYSNGTGLNPLKSITVLYEPSLLSYR